MRAATYKNRKFFIAVHGFPELRLGLGRMVLVLLTLPTVPASSALLVRSRRDRRRALVKDGRTADLPIESRKLLLAHLVERSSFSTNLACCCLLL